MPSKHFVYELSQGTLNTPLLPQTTVLAYAEYSVRLSKQRCMLLLLSLATTKRYVALLLRRKELSND